jgi:hypothetical protein
MSIPLAALKAAADDDLDNFLVAATPGGIEAQEKRGQMALVNSTNMPIEMHPDRAAFERIGFVFGDTVDDLFVSATLPPGWTRAATDHSMHSVINDERGRERVSIFYKAAFYDRRADARLTPRWTIETSYGEEDVCLLVKDGETELYRTAAIDRRDYAGRGALEKEAIAWLETYVPESVDRYAWD